MCGKCHTFYCEECKNALVAMENRCWTCVEPLDRGRELAEQGTSLDGTSKTKPEVQDITVEAIDKEPDKTPMKGVVAGKDRARKHKKLDDK
ncbi:MAG TPA: hypothetical protein VKM55_10455 [Candidatus Lokiarchaeia archaeon]|nr:hypothetical protein [Candidatus Lokiarchaeia archaeon]